MQETKRFVYRGFDAVFSRLSEEKSSPDAEDL